MKEHNPTALDTQEESYFASFTDMLVGILFIFIILLMIVANNYQEATEAVTETNKALQEARNQARDTARDTARDNERDKARDAAHDRLRDAAYAQQMAQLQAQADAKAFEAAQALEKIRALEEAKAYLEEKAREAAATPPTLQAVPKPQGVPGLTALPSIQTIEQAKSAGATKATDEATKHRLLATQQNLFNDSRAKVLRKIQETMNMQGFPVTADLRQGILLIPESILFDANWNRGSVNYKGKQTLSTLASLFGKYLPCISPTANTARLSDCGGLGFTPNDGLDVIFIDDYPDMGTAKENKLLLSVQRVVSVFDELKLNEPYLDRQLRNTAGAPILDIKVNQERRKAWNQQRNPPGVNRTVMLRFIMRRPNHGDVLRLLNSGVR